MTMGIVTNARVDEEAADAIVADAPVASSATIGAGGAAVSTVPGPVPFAVRGTTIGTAGAGTGSPFGPVVGVT
jgi:hypothetical protein